MPAACHGVYLVSSQMRHVLVLLLLLLQALPSLM
jgi:hypothetical protein